MIEVCAGEASGWLNRYRYQRPAFACILSFTETALIPQISAAGLSPEAGRYTAAADGEFLAVPSRLPALPNGISPVVITRAILHGLSLPCQLLSTGLPVPLRAPHIVLPTVLAQAVHTGCAMSATQAEQLFTAGQFWGSHLAPKDSYLVIGECVVGGTTTAQAVLTALGYSAAGKMSSSHPIANHTQKQALVAAGLSRWRQQIRHQNSIQTTSGLANSWRASPLAAAAAVGDPMQLVAAGMALAASRCSGVLLAGGAQMLAVYALARELAQQYHLAWRAEQIVVGTTRWVIADERADTVDIARQIGVPYLASRINFSRSAYAHLRAYERGFVKEGVGAGGCAIAAYLYKDWNESQLRHAVEAQLRHAF